ncbi:UDP-glucose flavonoid 3-O-glucosyltransferase [Dirofilaria immitis]
MFSRIFREFQLFDLFASNCLDEEVEKISCKTISNQQLACILRCKDGNMNDMANILGIADHWTKNLVTPLHSILIGLPKNSRHRINNFAQRIENICKSNAEFASCINRCGDQTIGHILLKGQVSWTSICDAYHYNTGDFLSFIIPCWSRHGNDVVTLCASQAAILQHTASNLVDSGIQKVSENLDDLCRSVTMHDKCYVKQSNKFCGLKMHEFLINLSHRSFRTLLELLQESGLIKHLPDSCEHWAKKSSSYHWHNERENAQRRDISASNKVMLEKWMMVERFSQITYRKAKH